MPDIIRPYPPQHRPQTNLPLMLALHASFRECRTIPTAKPRVLDKYDRFVHGTHPETRGFVACIQEMLRVSLLGAVCISTDLVQL